MWSTPGRVLAQDNTQSTVLVVRVRGDDNIVLRLRAELSSYRFRVVELPPARRAEALAQLAEEREAQAALRAKPEAMAVEVWVRPRSAGARSTEELVTAGPGRDPTVLAVRVTEAMRARGLVLPPLTAAVAAEGGRRGGRPDDGAQGDAPGASKPSAAGSSDADEEVGPARPTVLPPEAVRATTPSPDPKRGAGEEQERKGAGESKAEPERKAAERKAGSDSKADAERKAAERKADERKAGSDSKADAERKPDAKVRAEAARNAERAQKAVAERTAPADSNADAARDPEDTQRTSLAPSSAAPGRSALLYAEIGPTGVWSPGTNSLGPALDAFVSLKFRPYQTSSVSLVGLIPLLSTDFTSEDGTAIEVQTFGIGGFGDLHLPLGPVALNVGIGGMAMLSSIRDSSKGVVYNQDKSSQRLAALLGRVGASISLTADLRLAAAIMLGLTVQELTLKFLDAQGAALKPEVRWGNPLLFGTLSLELALPWDR